MALFKIFKGLAANLPTTYHEGYCYITTDDGKMYIDTTDTVSGRIVLNSGIAEKLKNKIIFNSNGSKIGEFDGSTEVEIEIGSALAGEFLPLSGGTLTGDLTLQKNLVLTENYSYGNSLPEAAVEGQIFFLPDDDLYVPTGGTAGQVLVKNSNTDGDYIWGDAGAAAKLQTARTISLTGDATGSTSFDGSGDVSITVAVADNSHNHNYLPLAGGTLTGDLIIKKSTSIATDAPAQILFQNYQTDNAITNESAWIRVYDDHDDSTYGGTMVIQSGGNMIIGGGESPTTCYTTDFVGSSGENTYITADGSIYFFTNCNTYANKTSSVYINTEGALYGAVWNDYAEFRELKEDIEIPYGRVVIENGDDTLSLSTKRLQGGGNICSDTFGFAIGETEKAKMPIAVSGRALVYPYEDRNSYKPGDAVCTGPEGTVSKMTREEIKEYPDRIIGYVSAIPNYEIWGEKDVAVNNRIWIKVV